MHSATQTAPTRYRSVGVIDTVHPALRLLSTIWVTVKTRMNPASISDSAAP